MSILEHRARAAFLKGQKAYKAGKTLDANPYTHETSIQSANHRAWKTGFNYGSRSPDHVFENGAYGVCRRCGHEWHPNP